MPVTTTINPLHLEDLDPRRFEDLVRQLIYGFRRWHTLEPSGRLGSDAGVDILGIEAVESDVPEDDPDADDSPAAPQGMRKWLVQCKRWQRMTPSQIRTVVSEMLAGEEVPPHGILVVVACDVSAGAFAAFHEKAARKGVREHHIWTRSVLEDRLFRPDNDHLLFAYFGISLGVRRSSRIRELRRHLALKKKLLRAFDLEQRAIVATHFKDILLRNIDLTTYPFDADGRPVAPSLPRVSPLQDVALDSFAPEGIWVVRLMFSGWVKTDGTWDVIEDDPSPAGHIGQLRMREAGLSSRQNSVKAKAREVRQQLAAAIPAGESLLVLEQRLIPYERMVEVDPIGDSWFPGVHLIVQHVGEDGPYTRGPWLVGRRSGSGGTVVALDLDDRRPLFAELRKQLSASGQGRRAGKRQRTRQTPSKVPRRASDR